MRLLLATLAVTIFMAPLLVYAVFVPNLETGLSLETIPRNPEPGSVITVRAQNISSTLGSALFIWRVNGSIVDQGVGRDAIQVQLGESGSVTTINLTLSQDGAPVAEKQLRLRPALVSIEWEGDTYTPPFYEGRPLPTGSSRTILSAIPYFIQNGSRLNPDNLIYSWFINGSPRPVRTGVGVHSISIDSPQFENNFDVSVTVQSPDGVQQATHTVTVTPVRPEIVVYEYMPLLGLRFDRAITNIKNLNEDEVTFQAFPLFVQDITTPEYEWRVNGEVTKNTGRTERELTLRRSGDGGGSAPISFELKNLQQIFEQAETSFRLNF